ncbi:MULTISPECIES: hypothetical protein [unclassified Spirosoma]|uniref:hypothetical protein n=1 Tax=unclassified Spirosoma TaxID=2621999 RepID=UPI000960252D|nr:MULTISPECIES: hypothetical protein [unclassified Spirosoma]MBN8823774.1 hypothetical protein [Spirosoma sp.]OJW79825.1 MAG: hypothetical protein BGO59_00825 [Spirosoma sp. 48-14]
MNWTAAQQEALLDVIRRRNERDHLQKQLERTQAELTTRQQQQANLRTEWQAEQADVDRLDRLSWASLYYDLLNTKEKQRSKEEAEAQQARLRYDVVTASVDELTQQLAEQKNRLTAYATVDTDYDRFIQEKRIALSFSAGYVGNQYQQRLDNLMAQNRQWQELEEAHKAGLQALNEVFRLRKLLEQARNWGTWDMLGGSTIASIAKYQKLDDVRDQSYRVTQSLERFRAEYADLNQAFLTEWRFDHTTTRFVDIFFDNIFTDLSVQSRIRSAAQTAQALENQLVNEISRLKKQVEQEVDQARQTSDALQKFLETA